MQVVESVKDADFILIHGTEALGLSTGDPLPMELEDLELVLEHCADKKIPMVVANPDFVTVEGRALRVMPGTVTFFQLYYAGQFEIKYWFMKIASAAPYCFI